MWNGKNHIGPGIYSMERERDLFILSIYLFIYLWNLPIKGDGYFCSGIYIYTCFFWIFCFPASLLFCFSAFFLFCFCLLLCFYSSLLLCFSSFLLLCFFASPLCCLSASPLFCFSLLFCFSSFCASLLSAFPCFSASLLTRFYVSLLFPFFCFSYCR